MLLEVVYIGKLFTGILIGFIFRHDLESTNLDKKTFPTVCHMAGAPSGLNDGPIDQNSSLRPNECGH